MHVKRSRSSASIASDHPGVPAGQDPSKYPRADSATFSRASSVDEYPLKVHIIPAKLAAGELASLISLVESSCGDRDAVPKLELAGDADQASVIVTAVRTRPRLERHVSWDLAKTKAIVTPDWLSDSMKIGALRPCGGYSALTDLHNETVEKCPDTKASSSRPLSPSSRDRSQAPTSMPPEGGAKESDLSSLNYLARFSCQRASPLICPNQDLVEELNILRKSRFFEGEERSMLSYARAIAAIKAYPYRFNDKTPRDTIAKLPYLGSKLVAMVEEFIKTGQVSEAQTILFSQRFASLSAFNMIHGVGPHTARRLYSLGLRTIEDMEKYYEVTPGITHEEAATLFEGKHGEEAATEKSIKIALSLRHDLNKTIPSNEVEEINRVVMQELESIGEGYASVIAGSYRRGKSESNDVDIVITHTDTNRGVENVRGLSKKLVKRLHERGLVKHVLNMSGHHSHNVFRTHHWDSLEKALTVFLLPPDSTPNQVYRRVDLIFATPGVFWTAVVGWTGSTMFERDLRLWAKGRGMKFDSSGITRRHDSKLFFPRTEREVFDILGLPCIPPTLRNADL